MWLWSRGSIFFPFLHVPSVIPQLFGDRPEGPGLHVWVCARVYPAAENLCLKVFIAGWCPEWGGEGEGFKNSTFAPQILWFGFGDEPGVPFGVLSLPPGSSLWLCEWLGLWSHQSLPKWPSVPSLYLFFDLFHMINSRLKGHCLCRLTVMSITCRLPHWSNSRGGNLKEPTVQCGGMTCAEETGQRAVSAQIAV
jgi:hypothetical protein